MSKVKNVPLNPKQWFFFPKWEDLPDNLRINEVRPYYEILNERRNSLIVKRIFDMIAALLLLVVLAIPMMIIGIAIKLSSNGPVFFRQERITTYGFSFRIHKFRTMVNDADKFGSAVTVSHDKRITKLGSMLRDLRLDEFPQLIDVLEGNMSFVGTRPEVPKYVERYQPNMLATLLLPAGITSEASINYRNESSAITDIENIDIVYIEEILPKKMEINLRYLINFSIKKDLKTGLKTLIAVL